MIPANDFYPKWKSNQIMQRLCYSKFYTKLKEREQFLVQLRKT